MILRRTPTDDRTVAVLGLGTALPGHPVPQADAARAVGVLNGRPRRTVRAFRLAGVATRYACVPDFDAAAPGPLARLPPPTTAQRMAVFARTAPELAARAARRALAAAGVPGSEIGHLVVVTCTGFSAPGVDLALVDALGLPAGVERTVVGFMGCHAAFVGLRAARRAVDATGGRALLVCVELGSLHVQPSASREALVSAALFGDGASAAVLGPAGDGGALVELDAGTSVLVPDSRDAMSWTIGDTGFVMSLSPGLPAAVGAVVRPLAESVGFAGTVPAGLCVHPGGPAVLDHVEAALGLRPGTLVHSRAALRDHGNLSSATILFVLERAVPHLAAGDRGLLLGFGPGLTLEGIGFARGMRALDRRPADALAVVS